ncbi:MAG: DUF4167 domain-containing protein [Afipia felis]|jgi:hypothetical protein|uniref:DUF4167 domain-containing protein n=2 Tax=Afipia felis TaxID=1035 RepID=A0A380W3H9_AFIFE|nr:DUF4167 domain-containing protein [Afipia felis]EKS30618.1 hypothetical protein HMPREF9697_03146 [Afipia felis ATCC 53690]MBN9603594.1 DUF4167 domain-containing protein [Afipia felis]SUU75363.1 Uncharacterised protein [Afipia felis]SUU83430.1 Uncharacterised protein [Afipia felis]
MRNGQNNNKRMRGRNNNNHNNNRRSQNPMTRVFESNGPDIKIRGTASHIAEKYVQLARDARSSGDPVAAENYYQHAEHYFRLIAAAQEQLRQNQPQQQQQPRMDNDLGEEAGEEDSYSNFGAEPGFAPQPQQFTPREQQPYPQPREQPQPREYREPRENRQPQAQPETGAAGLPSFITGGAQPAAGLESNATGAPPQGERFAHRRRRPRGPRPEAQAAMPQENGDLASE